MPFASMPELKTPARIMPILFFSAIGKKSSRALLWSKREYFPARTIQSKSPSFANLAHIFDSLTPTPIALITFYSLNFIKALYAPAIADLKSIVAELSISIAETVVREELSDKSKQEKLVESMLKDATLN